MRQRNFECESTNGQLNYKIKYKKYIIQSDTTLLLYLTVLYIYYILFYILANVQHNGDVSLENQNSDATLR